MSNGNGTPNAAHVLAMVVCAPSRTDDPRLALAYRRRAQAILAQYEEASRLRSLGINIGLFADLVPLPPAHAGEGVGE